MCRTEKATLTVKVSPFGPTFKGRSVLSNDPGGAWRFTVIEVQTCLPPRTFYEVHGEKIAGKGTGAKMDVVEVSMEEGGNVKALKLARRRADVVGGYIKDGELQLDVIDMSGQVLEAVP